MVFKAPSSPDGSMILRFHDYREDQNQTRQTSIEDSPPPAEHLANLLRRCAGAAEHKGGVARMT